VSTTQELYSPWSMEEKLHWFSFPEKLNPLALGTRSPFACACIGTGTFLDDMKIIEGRKVGEILIHGIRVSVIHRPAVVKDDSDLWSQSARANPLNCLCLPRHLYKRQSPLIGLWDGLPGEYWLVRSRMERLVSLWIGYAACRRLSGGLFSSSSGLYRVDYQNVSTGLKTALNAKWLKINDSYLTRLVNLAPIAYLGLLPMEEITANGQEALRRIWNSLRYDLKKKNPEATKDSRVYGKEPG